MGLFSGHSLARVRIIPVLAAAGVFLLLAYGNVTAAFASSWDQVVNVSETGVNAKDTSLAVGPNGSLNLVWIQEDDSEDDRLVMFARSVDRGATWSTPNTVAGDTGADVAAPQLVIDSVGRMTAMWESVDYAEDEGEQQAIRWARSSDNGQSWSTGQQASAAAVDSTQARLVLTADGDLVAMWSDGVWDSGEEVNEKWKVISAYKSFNDDSWTTSEEMTSDSGDTPTPKLIREASGTLTAMWDAEKDGVDSGRRVYTASSSDDGATWDSAVALSHDSGGLDTAVGDIVARGDGGITVLWSREEPDANRYKVEASYRSPEGNWQLPGGTSPGVVVLSDPTVASGRNPRLAAAGDAQVVAFWELGNEIQSKSSADGGVTWSADPQNLNDGAGVFDLPNSLMASTNSSGETLAVWVGEAEETLWSASSNDAGTTWTGREEVAELGYYASSGAGADLIAGNDGSFFISFEQDVASDRLVSVTGYLTALSTASSSENSSRSMDERVDDAGIHLDVQGVVGEQVAGSPVVIGGQGLAAGSAYTLVLRSTPQVIESGVANAAGNFSKEVVMPAGIAPGAHSVTLTAIGADGSTLSLVTSFVVSPSGVFSSVSPNVATATAGLAATGPADELWLWGSGFIALLLAGVVLTIARGRTRTTQSL